MFKLYYMQGACSLVPQVALEWAKVDYEAIAVGRDELKSKEFLLLNPQGVIPVLQEGDWILTQNMAILDYIDDVYPQAVLFGKGDKRDKAKARQWLAFANADVHKVFGFIFNPNKLLDGEGEGAQIRARSILQVTSQLSLVNNTLQHQDYLIGELTIADVYFYIILRWAKMLKIDLNELSALEGFYQRVQDNEGVRNALRKQGLL